MTTSARRLATLGIALILLGFGTPALAATRRLAVVVGSNAGSGDRPPLRFAETDAGKVARVLVELGGVAKEDVLLLQGRPLSEVETALQTARSRLASWKAEGVDRALVLFFYSGHSDGESLELGRDRLPYVKLKAWLDATGADVRVAIVDSCRSGALLSEKGARQGNGFDLRLVDDLVTSGNVLLASSAADEVALESSDIGGSYFTHHFVSGLRGAADASGDARVTLMEAYRHAFERTVAATSTLVSGGQHPTFDLDLSGQGELVLTELSRPGALLELPDGFDRAFVVQAARDVVASEVRAGDPRVVAVEPGTYTVRVWRGDRLLGGRVELAAGQRRTIGWGDLVAIATPGSFAKGGLGPKARWSFAAVLGASGGLAAPSFPRGSLRLGARVPDGPTVDVLGFVGVAGNAFEGGGLALAGWPFEFGLGPVTLGVVPVGGLGVVVQSVAGTPIAAAAPVLGGRLELRWPADTDLSLLVETGVVGALMRVDGAWTVVPLPSIQLGLRFLP